MNRQLAALRKQVEETRAVISSEGMLQMMRGQEDLRRNSASLRGSIDELQKAQADSATQMRNFYLDLDSRIQALKQKMPAHEASVSAPAASEPAPEVDRPGYAVRAGLRTEDSGLSNCERTSKTALH